MPDENQRDKGLETDEQRRWFFAHLGDTGLPSTDSMGRSRGRLSVHDIKPGDRLRAYIYGKPSSDDTVTKANPATIKFGNSWGQQGRYSKTDLANGTPGFYHVVARGGRE